MVTASNWREVASGHVEHGREDGDYVVGPIVVQDGAKLPRLDSGDLGELSAGYRVDYDPTPGEFRGQRYDGVQRNIRYNHVALLPPGTGRAGRECALRLDSDSAILETEKESQMETIRIDGKDYKVGSQELAEKLASMSAAAASLAAANARADKAEGERDALKTRADKAEEALVTANDPKRLDSLINERVALQTKAARVLGVEYKCDGKSPRDVMIDVIRADDKSFDAKDRTDAYVEGRFDSVKIPDGTIGALPGILNLPALGAIRKDSAAGGEAAARAKMIEDNHNAHKAKAS